MANTEGRKRKKSGFRLDIAIIIAIFILLISFCAYMLTTDLEDVLEKESGSSIVTHDYTYETDSE